MVPVGVREEATSSRAINREKNEKLLPLFSFFSQ